MSQEAEREDKEGDTGGPQWRHTPNDLKNLNRPYFLKVSQPSYSLASFHSSKMAASSDTLLLLHSPETSDSGLVLNLVQLD